ncbi:SH3 domain-containing protein [Vibrio sp. S4M6]|uniref:SH3 domain-containing protein n=1 Tax=Vibrio sinus TaxID=2946865 RepID=UPI00202A3DB5|nr:SH3 domain-containing protein [Vibrio sinus]MCL9783303.1 SH3 domain-containing protein [Vibrio sinus]
MKTFFFACFLLLPSSFAFAKVEAYFVAVNELNVRLGPSLQSSVAHVMKQGDVVGVFEQKGGWARISEYYPAHFESSMKGSTKQLARWVYSAHLSKQRINNLISSPTSQLEEAIEFSDDFSIHRSIFLKIANDLINKGRCTLQDFVRNGGWYRSLSHKPEAIYFTYCGKTHISNRIYLDPVKVALLN